MPLADKPSLTAAILCTMSTPILPLTAAPATDSTSLEPGLIVLAPMDGVLDHTLRDLLTALGGIDRCVTEFVRVTDQLLPKRTFLRLCPELQEGGRTPAGVPVYVQLLGGQSEPLALNAARAAALGAPGVDLNFGCPAKTVNRHDGGSILLREPERVHRLVAAVRAAVPAITPVSVKIRLGFNDTEMLMDLARGVEAAGASELAIHARTRADGYRPPAHWHLVAALREQLRIPLVINGEIWTYADALRAQQDSGCQHLMLGRGALSRPDLPRLLHAHMHHPDTLPPSLPWLAVVNLLQALLKQTLHHYPVRHAGNPIKQWLGYLRTSYAQATELFERIKRLREPADLDAALAAAIPDRVSLPSPKRAHSFDKPYKKQSYSMTLP